ncbi:MAG: transcriptional repressor [Tannerella sp.]|nr:transcriptional repressor [Tannerella sp.]
MNTTSQYLTNNGIRPSVQRLAVMQFLQHNKTHPTVDEVFEALRTEIPTLSKTTVYNTLKLFIERKAINYISIDERNARFDSVIQPHAHFRCKECDRIIDIDLDINQFLPENFRGEINESFFYLKGFCEECKKLRS